ncbi:hypothetical protein [Sebaldella sp. S0638]|uniref:hypothetical protein n=1 Tax=Sebaldella sp. S0638 TaxID=2957809 RepID=UPI00209C80B1|nr:hypothetical protein [Sebaldella sp. S0638]MCP1223392.1 hypothetical protein [Sebaldella sp. S0638]
MNKIKKIMLIIKMFGRGFIFYKKNGSFLFFKRIFCTTKNRNIIGITRVRNEELLIEDALRDAGKVVDSLIVFDDCSIDKTINKIVKSKKVNKIIINTYWDINCPENETIHREILLKEAHSEKGAWIFNFDADERFEGEIREFLLENLNNDSFDSIKIRLYDAYITKYDEEKEYKKADKLLNFRKYFGPEYRDILMIWRNKKYFKHEGLIQREPSGAKNSITKFRCQHYGKAISVEQWEETCKFYETYFPEPYKSKWSNRKGKAIHTLSDFGNTLYPWGEELFTKSFILDN